MGKRVLFIALTVILAATVFGSLATLNTALADEPPGGTIGDPWTTKLECETVWVPEALAKWEHTKPINIECEFDQTDIPSVYGSSVLAFAEQTGSDSWIIHILPEFFKYSFEGEMQTMLHEVGHCLLMRHSDDIKSIMYPIVIDGESQTITADDRHMYDIRWHGFKTVLPGLAIN